MTDEPTAWQDINPTTGLVPRREPQLPCSARLQPASNETFRNELTACLALVVPVGMTEESRREWLAVAWATLKHLPPDVLIYGCKKARETCEHPSKIVPTILAETEDWMRSRQNAARNEATDAIQIAPRKKHILDRDRRNFTAADWEELNGVLESMGAKSRYRADGTRYTVS